MIKIAIVSIITVLIALQFKEQPEYSIYMGIILSIIIASYILGKVDIVIETIDRFQRYISLDITYIRLLLKMIGITYIVEISLVQELEH